MSDQVISARRACALFEAKVCAAAFCLALLLVERAVAAPPINTPAEFAVILDYETGEVLFDKNGETPTAPASMSKLMTVAIAFEMLEAGELSLDDAFSVSEKAWRKGGSKMWVRVDTRIKVRDLLRGVIIQSGNDACIVLAENIAGSEEEFAKLMNRKAREWGLDDSTFANATGWPDPEHKMSMRDLATLARKIIHDYPEYYEIFAERDFTWEKIEQSNRNPLLDGFDGADGLKTGHTDESGYGVVGSAVRDGVRRIVVVNGLGDEAERLKESRRLMGVAFNDFVERRLFDAEDSVGAAQVFGGEAPATPLVVAEDVEIIVHRAQAREVKAMVVYNGPIAAPIRKGAQLGVLQVTFDDSTKTYPVFASENVREVGFFGKVALGAKKLLLKPEKTPEAEEEPQSAGKIGV